MAVGIFRPRGTATPRVSQYHRPRELLVADAAARDRFSSLSCIAEDAFGSWLEGDGDRLYWITGKAGSGKSTLMKFIVNNELCGEYLKCRRGGHPLVLGRFSFWNSGSQDQMSQEGLLQSLLQDVLAQMPRIIPYVFPKRWARCNLFGSDPRPWSSAELVQGFKSLATLAARGSFKVCFFVDRLDEFNGKLEALIDLFRDAIGSPNVKACLSSRPPLGHFRRILPLPPKSHASGSDVR